MSRRKLGNDPFVRGAAPRNRPQTVPAQGPEAPIPASAKSAPLTEVITPESVVRDPVLEPPHAEWPGDLQMVDDFGRDAAFEARALKLLEPVYRNYFRVEVRGLEHVPSSGPIILVANHSGALPWDVAMLKTALSLDHPGKRSLRPLIENFLFHFPFLGVALNRFGAVRACQENAEALLDAGEAIAVFPEGAKGQGKTIRKRYQLQRFGRGGFIKLALRTGAPIVPVAIVGAEETHPLLARLTRPAAPLGLPFLPVTPTFPLLGPAGLLPLPTKWTIEFAPMVSLGKNPGADELTVERLTEDVRAGIQGQLDRITRGRRGIFS